MADPTAELTILMPCLNEEATVGRCVEQAVDYLARAQLTGEVLVADNGSTDGSVAAAEKAGARVAHISPKGYGSALRHGIAAARGRYVIMGDSDLSYSFAQLDPFLQKLREGFPLVMGDRFAGGIAPGAMPFANRYIGNPLLSALARWRCHTDIRDFHCGLRGVERDAFLALDCQADGMEFATEMVLRFVRSGAPIAQVPTTLSPDQRPGKPHLRPIRDGLRHLKIIFSKQEEHK